MAERRLPNEEDYPSNSNSIEKVKGEVIEPVKMRGGLQRKRSLMKSVRDEFVKEDASSIGEVLLLDIFFPSLIDMLSDMGHSTVDILTGRNPSGRRYDNRRRRPYYDDDYSYISYNRMYDDRRRPRRDRDEDRYERRRRSRDLDDLIFDYRQDAEEILDRLLDKIEDYGCVTVSYLYDLMGETVYGDFTKEDWGWEDLSTARVRKVRGGYLLDLPRVRPI